MTAGLGIDNHFGDQTPRDGDEFGARGYDRGLGIAPLFFQSIDSREQGIDVAAALRDGVDQTVEFATDLGFAAEQPARALAIALGQRRRSEL